jgi:hypothetical protein
MNRCERDILLSTSSRTMRPSLCRQLGVVTVVETRRNRGHAREPIEIGCIKRQAA